MSDLRANSSDLERARLIARGLLAAPPPPGSPEEGGRFRFALGAAESAALDLALPAGAPWSQIVDQCLAQIGAMGMVIVDESGFVIASAGQWRDWSELHLEAVAARLLAVLDQLERLEGPWGRCNSVVLSLGADFLTGLRVATDAGVLTLALLASKPLPARVTLALQAQVGAALLAR